MKRTIPVFVVALVCALFYGITVSALVGNGDFETGNFNNWSVTSYINNGFSAPRASGGANLSSVVGGPGVAPMSQTDPRTNNNVRFPAYGNYSAKVNSELSYAGGGWQSNGNLITQTVPAYIDPSDGKAHLKFAYAAVMVNPTDHTPETKPYFRVRAINRSNGNDVLYDFTSYVGEPGKNWVTGQAFNSSSDWQYLNWTVVDLSPTDAHPVNAGDNVELEVMAAGCEPNGHPGYVYVDEITDNEIAGPTVKASGPATTGSGSTITYTYNYRNGASVPVNATVRATQPTGVTFTSASDANCGLAAGTVTCNFSNVAANGGSGSFTVSGTVTAATGSQIAHGNYDIAATAVPPATTMFPTVGGQTVFTNVTTSSTQTAVSSSTNPSSFGQNVIFTANVTSGGGTPTGNVQFQIDGANFGSPVALSSGSASVNTSALSVGNHPVTANYVAGPGFSGSSGTLAGGQTVNRASASVAVGSSVNPSVFGQSVNFTATVSGPAGTGTPSGTITFRANGTALCTAVAMTAGQATCATSNLSVGNHPVTADYSGDGNFNTAGGSLTGGQTVNRADSSVSVSSSPSPSVTGQPVTLTATVSAVSPGSGTPTGTVTFRVDGNVVCASATVSGGTATCGAPTMGAGSHPLSVSYNGDSNFNTSNGSGSHTVNRANTSTGVSSSPNPSVTGQPVTLSATVTAASPGAGTPTGTVTFRLDGNVVCAAAVLSAGSATCAAPAMAASIHPVAVDYNGDSNFNTSSGSGSHTVNAAETTTSVTSTPNPSVTGQAFALNASVAAGAPGAGTPTGTVTFRVNGSVVCASATLVSGGATCAVAGMSAGSHAVTASYSGDSNFNTSVGSDTHVVNKSETSATISSSPLPSVTGQGVTLTAAVSASAPGAGTPSGTVTISVDGSVVCSGAALIAGVATCSVPSLNARSHPLSVGYGGDANFNGSSGTGTHQTNAAATTTALTSSPNPSVAGQPVVVTATVRPVAPGAGVPTGPVTFNLNGTPVCVSVPSLNGVALCDLPYMVAGDHEITAEYAGDPNFLPSGGGLNPRHSVGKASTAINVSSSLNPSIYGQEVIFTATVSAVAPGSGTPTGSITFMAGGATLCTAVAMNSASAGCATSALNAGSYSVTAQYSGDANFNPVGGSLTGDPQVVQKADTVTVITNADALSASTGIGVPYAVKWTVDPVAPGAGTRTGSVTVSDGNASCSAAVAAGECELISTGAGRKTITATYHGDPNFNPSTSAGVTHDVTATISGQIIKSNAPVAVDAPLAGVTVNLTGSMQMSTTTDANGRYSFAGLTGGQGYVVTPSGHSMTYEATNRTYSNLTANITNADFMAYTAAQMERDLIIGNGYTVAGTPAEVPVTLKAKGNEASMTFSFSYDTRYLSDPVASCGPSAPGCTVMFDAGRPGVLGVSITPTAPFAEGQREIATITFQTFTNPESNTGLVFGQVPMNSVVRDASGNPLVSRYTNGYVVFQQGMEGDLAGRFAGDGILRSKDVEMMRRFATGDPMNVAFNELQRADVAPYETSGDGRIDATDFQTVKNMVSWLIPQKQAAGPMEPVPFGAGQPSLNDPESANGRSVRVASTSAIAGRKAVVRIEIDALGDETASLFTLMFDQSRLSNPVVSFDTSLEQNTMLTANTDAAADGRITMLLDSPEPFLASARKVITITFDVAKDAPNGLTRLSFGAAGSFSDLNGRFLSAHYIDGAVNIGGRMMEYTR